VRDLIARCKESAKSPHPQSPASGLLPVGSRVLHPKFGIGHIREASKDSYSVEFQRVGMKEIDALMGGLKMF
jgi:hypothetical protein